MERRKIIYGQIAGIVGCVAVFVLANTGRFFGAALNRLSPCVQDRTNSFPCYGMYDVGVMALAGLGGLALAGSVIYGLVGRRRSCG